MIAVGFYTCNLEMNNVHNVFVFFFSFAVSQQVRYKDELFPVVRHQVVSDGGVSSQLIKLNVPSWSCLLQCWSIFSVVCQSSSSNREVDDGTTISFVCTCAFHLLFPVLSLTIITCSGLLRMLYASFF